MKIRIMIKTKIIIMIKIKIIIMIKTKIIIKIKIRIIIKTKIKVIIKKIIKTKKRIRKKEMMVMKIKEKGIVVSFVINAIIIMKKMK